MAQDTGKELRNKVIYQVFTRNYKEGTFLAVEKDLPRIKALGTDIIYFLPIQPSGIVHRKGSLGSPYAIRDYRAVDPQLGTMEDFIHLTEAVHQAGMQVMLDVVYNHTSPDSWLAQNHPEWFFHKEDGSFGNRIGDWWDVIDLDYTNKELWTYQIDTLKMWAQYVDGFRCDVAPLLPLDFWKQARKEVETVRPGCIWLAEAVEHSFIANCRKTGIPVLSDGELYQAFDICYDYDVYEYQAAAMTGCGSAGLTSAAAGAAGGHIPTAADCTLEYLRRVNFQESIFPDNFCKLRCLENHDRPRAATLVPDEKIRRSWTAWIYFVKGCTMIYMGQEYSATRHPTLFDLDTVEMGADNEDFPAFLAALAAIRHNPLLANSAFHARMAGSEGDVILAVHEAYRDAAFGDTASEDTASGDTVANHTTAPGSSTRAIGLFSTTGRRQGLKIDLPDGTYTNAITGGPVEIFEKTLLFEGEPMVIFTE